MKGAFYADQCYTPDLLSVSSLGLLIGWFGRVERFADPLLQAFRQTSALALFPVFILFFGNIGVAGEKVQHLERRFAHRGLSGG